MKKFIHSLILALSFILMLTSFCVIIASAASNTSSSTAHDFGTLQEGTNYSQSGSIEVNGRDYWYKFTVEEAGELTVKFNHAIINSKSNYWQFVCYQADATTFLTGTSSMVPYWKIAGNESQTVVDGIFLEAGTYYIKVTSGEMHSSDAYTISLTYEYDDCTETEYNSSYQTANKLKLNTAYRGSLTSSTDVDWFTFTTETDGYFWIDFDHNINASSDNTWSIYIYHADGTSYICDETNYWAVKDNVESFNTPKIGIKAGTYYIKIIDNIKHSDEIYTFKVNFTEADNWEKESNHTYLLANDMGTSRLWYGTTATSPYNSDETDWFKVNLTYSANYTLKFSHPQVNGAKENVWSVSVYTSDGTTRLVYESVKGGSDLELDLGTLSGIYYIRVMANLKHSSEVYCISITDDHSHSYSSTSTQYSSTQHISECTLCHETAKFNHDWDSGRVTTAPTCTESGEKLYKCNSCSYEKTETLDPEHKKITVEGKEATCTEEGYTDKIYCNVCQTVFSESQPIAAKGHKESDWMYYNNVTCTEGSDRFKECTRCHVVLEEGHTDALGHIYHVEETVAPNCEDAGYKRHLCSRCGETYDEKTEDALGHSYELTYDLAPTCEYGGRKEYVCSTCQNEYFEDIDALGHDYSAEVRAPTCSEMGETKYTCNRCQNYYLDDFVDSTGIHSYGAPTEIDGYIVTVCDKCGNTVSTPVSKTENNGCGSTVGFGTASILVIVSLAGSLLLRKKED